MGTVTACSDLEGNTSLVTRPARHNTFGLPKLPKQPNGLDDKKGDFDGQHVDAR